MQKRLFNTFSLIIITGFLWFGFFNFDHIDFIDTRKLALSMSAVTVTYILFKVVLENLALGRANANKARYSLRKTISLLNIFITTFIILRIWVPDPGTLVVAYGFIAAAVAFALQDFFKNFVGGITIVTRNVYKVGDRVSVGDVAGDVIDIGLLYTSILEMQSWVRGDQPSGRIATVPNGHVLGSPILNYTDDHSFIWDEIHIPITYDSDWKKADEIVLQVISQETKEIMPRAQKEIDHLRRRYFLSQANVEPRVFVSITDNWISLYGRYIAPVRERRVLNDIIMRHILEAFEKEQSIRIASETMTISRESGRAL